MKTYGPYTRKDGRQQVIHYYDKKRTTESYPRYLWKLHHGTIPFGYEVDHIDNNHENNSIDNFQLLKKADNIRKSSKNPVYVTLICKYCSSPFKRLERVELRNRLTKQGPYCSRRCSGKVHH